MADVSVRIPEGRDPWIAIVNGEQYSYPAGSVQTVPDFIAEIIHECEAPLCSIPPDKTIHPTRFFTIDIMFNDDDEPVSTPTDVDEVTRLIREGYLFAVRFHFPYTDDCTGLLANVSHWSDARSMDGLLVSPLIQGDFELIKIDHQGSASYW